MENLVIHIGMHKTGTSWLQRKLFASHPQIHSLVNSDEPWDDELIRYLVLSTPGCFERDRARQLLKNATIQHKIGKDQTVVISAERLSGHPLSGGHDAILLAKRLHDLAPESKIILVLRNQADMLLSIYRQMVMEGHLGSLEELIRSECWKAPYFSMNYLHYDRIVKCYLELFGSDRLLVLPFGELQNDAEAFSIKVQRFMNVHEHSVPESDVLVNPSFGFAAIALLRRLNRIRRSEYNRYPIIAISPSVFYLIARVVNKAFANRITLSDQLKLRVKEMYSDSNQRLQEITGLELLGRW